MSPSCFGAEPFLVRFACGARVPENKVILIDGRGRMHYLIDGHNLIAKLPDISLEDPYDEAKLVLQLRSWIAAGRNRRITVIFDGGLPGGEWRQLSNGRLKAIFASENSTADALLRKRVYQVKDSGAYTLVSSDREVLSAAKSRRMRYMTAEQFAQSMAKFKKRHQIKKTETVADSELEQNLTNEEVAEWLQMFESAAPIVPPGDDKSADKPHKKPAPIRGSKVAESTVDKPSNRPAVEPADIKSGTHKLNDDEVSEWLEIFGNGDDQTP
jgi:predicted RNA-binding protein with PIN domain